MNSHTFYPQNGTQNETVTAQCLRSIDPKMNLDCCTTGFCRGWLPPSSYYCDQNNYCIITNGGIAFPIIIVLILVCIWASGWYFLAVNEGWIEDDFLKNCSDLFRYCLGLFINQAGQAANGRPSNVAQSSGLPNNVATYGQNAVTYNAAYCRDGSPSISGEESVSGEGSHSGERSPTSAVANSVDTGSIKAGSKEKMPQECSVSLEGSPSGEGASALANSAKTGNIKAGTKEKLPKECSVSGEGSPLGERSPSVKEFPSGERSPASALTNSVDTGSIQTGTKEKIPKECSGFDEGSPASALTNSAETGSIKDETKEKRPRECSVSG